MSAPFGLSQYTTWPLTWKQDLRLCRSLDIKSIELCESKLHPSDPERDLRAVQASGLTVTSVQPRYHSPYPNSLRAAPASPRARMIELRKSIRLFSRYFPGTTLVLNTGLAPKGNIDLAQRVAIKEFKTIAAFAGDHGVRVALEPLNPVFMNTDTFVCTLAQAGEMIDAVADPAFGLFLDVWHYWEDVTAPVTIRRYRGRIFGSTSAIGARRGHLGIAYCLAPGKSRSSTC